VASDSVLGIRDDRASSDEGDEIGGIGNDSDAGGDGGRDAAGATVAESEEGTETLGIAVVSISTTCPVCDQKITGTEEKISHHVERCLAKGV
jgi:hypothetical protein